MHSEGKQNLEAASDESCSEEKNGAERRVRDESKKIILKGI